jgi:hypothetical protein
VWNSPGIFGTSPIASEIAGGGSAIAASTADGSTGVPGFSLSLIISEPGTTSIIGWGAAGVFILRRRSVRKEQ